MNVIQSHKLTKTYPCGTEALRGIDLEIKKGEVFCLVGPNGAGKTTLMRILGTQLVPSGGRVKILGLDLENEMKQIRAHMACVPQGAYPDVQLKVWEHIYYFLLARGQSRPSAKRSTQQVVEQLGLEDKYNAKIAELSGGMQRRVLLGMVLASRSELLLLDEPTAGLDLFIRRQTWQCLSEHLRSMSTILLTTHSMEEAESVADRVGIVNEGQLIAVGTPLELKSLAPAQGKVVIKNGSVPHNLLQRFGEIQVYGGKLAVFPKKRESMHRLLDFLVERSIDSSVMSASLEDAFVHFVGNNHSSPKEQP